MLSVLSQLELKERLHGLERVRTPYHLSNRLAFQVLAESDRTRTELGENLHTVETKLQSSEDHYRQLQREQHRLLSV